MRPFAVDLVLLRATAPDLPLVVGRVLAARVVERHGQHGVLNLAGAYLTAELPDEVQAGDKLRLVVQEAVGDRVVLALAEGLPGPGQIPPPPAEAPAAPADSAIVLGTDGDGSADGERAHVVTLRFEGTALGTVELRVALDAALVHARAALAEGPGLALARTRAGALRAALAGAAGRPAEVEVVARPNPLDVYV
ncbi:MAG TPA: hypothetical protein VFF79_04360 [Conexibacter sp.]|jgi:hypothetical protein|nr:hypothetical protein [Conexibacter sp.]